MKLKSLLQNRSIITLFSFLVATFIIGIADALQTPTLSRFLTDEIKVSPFLVGLFFSISAIAEVVISFLLALYSDKQGNRRNIILFCCAMGIIDSIIFAFTRHYITLVIAVVLLASLASAAMPQIFALAREYAIKSGRNIVTFNALLRAQISLAWVLGPPLSFILVVDFGFITMYLFAAVLFLLAIIVVVSLLPSMHRKDVKKVKAVGHSENILSNPSVILLFIATVFMWTSNMMYIIDMPLYTEQTLKLSLALPGHLMGISAAIEIPVMLIASLLVPRFGKKELFCFGIVCGMVFYSGMILFENEWVLICLQLFNGIFIGIIASIGIIYFQDLMPNRAGVASTLFTNGIACSVILAGLIQGSITEFFGHHVIYLIALGMIVISFLCCLLVRPSSLVSWTDWC